MVMEQQRRNCPKRARHTERRWNNTTSRRLILSSARTMRLVVLRTIPLTCTVSSSRRLKTSWNNGFDMHSNMARRTFTCKIFAWECERRNVANSSSIVGKGNHSVNHVQKIKPRVEQVCNELGLQYNTEENAGRIYVNLTGGAAVPPAHQGGSHGGQNQHHGGQSGYPGGQQHGGQHHGNNQQNQQNDELEKLAKKLLPRVIRKLEGCCVVM